MIESIISNINIIDSKVEHKFLWGSKKATGVMRVFIEQALWPAVQSNLLFLTSRKHLSVGRASS